MIQFLTLAILSIRLTHVLYALTCSRSSQLAEALRLCPMNRIATWNLSFSRLLSVVFSVLSCFFLVCKASFQCPPSDTREKLFENALFHLVVVVESRTTLLVCFCSLPSFPSFLPQLSKRSSPFVWVSVVSYHCSKRSRMLDTSKIIKGKLWLLMHTFVLLFSPLQLIPSWR